VVGIEINTYNPAAVQHKCHENVSNAINILIYGIQEISALMRVHQRAVTLPEPLSLGGEFRVLITESGLVLSGFMYLARICHQAAWKSGKALAH